MVYGKYRRRIELQKFNVGVCLSSCSRYMFYWLRHRFYYKRLCFTPPQSPLLPLISIAAFLFHSIGGLNVLLLRALDIEEWRLEWATTTLFISSSGLQVHTMLHAFPNILRDLIYTALSVAPPCHQMRPIAYLDFRWWVVTLGHTSTSRVYVFVHNPTHTQYRICRRLPEGQKYPFCRNQYFRQGNNLDYIFFLLSAIRFGKNSEWIRATTACASSIT